MYQSNCDKVRGMAALIVRFVPDETETTSPVIKLCISS